MVWSRREFSSKKIIKKPGSIQPHYPLKLRLIQVQSILTVLYSELPYKIGQNFMVIQYLS